MDNLFTNPRCGLSTSFSSLAHTRMDSFPVSLLLSFSNRLNAFQHIHGPYYYCY